MKIIPTAADYIAATALRQTIINLMVQTGLLPDKDAVIDLLAMFRATARADIPARERAAFVQGWEALDVDDYKAEALRRYPDEAIVGGHE